MKIKTNIGLPGLLAVAFIVLKLCKVINWSWWWVLSPIWISGLLILAILLVVFILAVIAKCLWLSSHLTRSMI